MIVKKNVGKINLFQYGNFKTKRNKTKCSSGAGHRRNQERQTDLREEKAERRGEETPLFQLQLRKDQQDLQEEAAKKQRDKEVSLVIIQQLKEKTQC